MSWIWERLTGDLLPGDGQVPDLDVVLRCLGRLRRLDEAPVVRPVDGRAVGALEPRMAGDELPRVIDLDHLAIGQDFDTLAGQAARDRVAVRLVVLGHVSERAFLDHIGSPALHGEQQVLLLEEHLRGLAMGRPVDALVGHLDDPLEKLRVEIVEARKVLPPEEALDVLDARFHLALGLADGASGGSRNAG